MLILEITIVLLLVIDLVVLPSTYATRERGGNILPDINFKKAKQEAHGEQKKFF